MKTDLFQSNKGMLHYFVRPEDAFILNSLEKLSADEYLYRLLRSQGYQRIFFVDIDVTNCSVWSYDKLSYWSVTEPRKFEQVDTSDSAAVSRFLDNAGGQQNQTEPSAPAPGLNLMFTTPQTPQTQAPVRSVPDVGRCKMETFRSAAEFENFALSRIQPALMGENIKSAVVLRMELYGQESAPAQTMTNIVRVAYRNSRSKKNIIVFTLPYRHYFLNVMGSSSFRDLHDWSARVMEQASMGRDRAEVILDDLREQGVLVRADSICADEIANLLLRKKLVERDPRYARIPVTKIYGLADLLAEQCRMDATHFQFFKPYRMNDYIRQLNTLLDHDSALEELTRKALELPARTLKLLDPIDPINLERVFGTPVVRFQRSEQEIDREYENAMQGLRDLIGLDGVKSKLAMHLDMVRAYGVKDGPGHYIFSGNPGTGKTEVARQMGKIFKALGLLKTDRVVSCRKGDLVAEHVGGSQQKTRAKCQEALDGVLFLDEAYDLVNTEPDGRKFASKFDEEAYTELMAFMEDHRDRICVICAGYRDKMQKFHSANPGMVSRIPESNVIDFADYSADQLYDIFVRFAAREEPGFQLTEAFSASLRKLISDMVKNPPEDFGNAREMRTLFASCKGCAASRYMRTRDEARKFLLVAEDIPEDMRSNISERELEAAMASLNELIGLEGVKETLEGLLETKRIYGDDKGPGHYVFAGNPGTGKTEVARKLGKIFKAMGLLRKGNVVECRAADLIASFEGQTAAKTRAKCVEALDGVLFVDEAYSLINLNPTDNKFASSFAEEAYTEIMAFMENNRHRICVIFAGYTGPMQLFVKANDGMESRISDTIHFPDYSSEELLQILELMAKKQGFTFGEDFPEAAKKAIAMEKKSGGDTFANAREVRDLLDKMKKKLARRMTKLGREHGQEAVEAQKFILRAEDVPALQESCGELENAMASLNELIGLDGVKTAIARLLTKKRIYESEQGPGHYVFAGNPGTGKTEVAGKLGAIFKAMGLLRRGHVVSCRAADLVAGAVGQTGTKTRAKCEEALDGVLFVDEAYALINTEAAGGKFASSFAEETYTEIMTFMEDNRHRVCVIFAGYSDLMRKFVEANEGMPSRITATIDFPDYSDAELVRILELMAKKEKFTFGEGFAAAAQEAIRRRRQECTGKFANAREARNLFDIFKQNAAQRMQQLLDAGQEAQVAAQRYILLPEDTRSGALEDKREDIGEAMKDLNDLIGLQSVKARIKAIKNNVLHPVDPTKPIAPGHYVFAGNPGTGKTEVARLMGRIFKAIGVLSKGHVVEVSKGDLEGDYVGHTTHITEERCKQALGGVLFVDEAYTLYSGSENDFGKQALDTIMKFMEDNRDRICVIFAGYEDKMKLLSKVNPGFNSRITATIHFPDYTAQELLQILRFFARKKGVELSDGFVQRADTYFQLLVANKPKEFGNARTVRGILDRAVENRANRIAEAIENGAEPGSIQNNLLVPEDLGLGSQTQDTTHNSTPAEDNYHRICAERIRSLPACYGPEVNGDRGKMKKATDPAVLFVKTNVGYGTAFLISPDGYALTCNHVIENATEIEARFRMPGRPGGRDSFHKCTVAYTLQDVDMALIKLEGQDFPYLKLAPQDREIQTLEEFLLSGYPFGMRTQKDLTTFVGYIASTDGLADDEGLIVYNINSEGKRGDSGAPVIAVSDGCVLGLLQGSITERGDGLVEEINQMRPIQYFWEEFTE